MIKDFIYKTLTDSDLPFYVKVSLVSSLHNCPTLSIEQLEQKLLHPSKTSHRLDEMIRFGTVWVRKIFFPLAGGVNEDHVHDFDHVTCIARGSVEVFIDGATEGKIFHAPNFVMVRAGHNHHMMALENETLMFCIHATDIEGGVDITSDNHDPMLDINSLATGRKVK